MTAPSFERIVHPSRRSAAGRRIRAHLAARTTMIGTSVRAARALDGVVSPSAQLRVMERFVCSIAR